MDEPFDEKKLFTATPQPEGRIRGKIHAYSHVVNAGMIICENRQEYLFSKKDWLSEQPPAEDLNVLFLVHGKWARSIIIEEPAKTGN